MYMLALRIKRNVPLRGRLKIGWDISRNMRSNWLLRRIVIGYCG
jgi:hypothetical protein